MPNFLSEEHPCEPEQEVSQSRNLDDISTAILVEMEQLDRREEVHFEYPEHVEDENNSKLPAISLIIQKISKY
jgi:hypothetical protein